MNVTKKVGQAGKELKEAIGAGWLSVVALTVGMLALTYRSSGPEGVWLRQLLAKVPLLGWLSLAALLVLALVLAAFHVRRVVHRKDEQAAGTELGGELDNAIASSSLVEVWDDFRAGFGLQMRRELGRFPVCVLLGAGASATQPLVRAYAGTEQRIAEALPAQLSRPFMNVHFGTKVVVQELSVALIADKREDVGRALQRLWNSTFRRCFGLLPGPVPAPVVVVAVDPAQLVGKDSDAVSRFGMSVRGKLDVLSRVCRRPIELRLALTELSGPGYEAYVTFAEKAGLATEVSLSDLVDDDTLAAEIDARLISFSAALPLALKQRSTAEYREIVAFLSSLRALSGPLSIFSKELLKDVHLSDTPDLKTLFLTHTQTHPSRFGANPLRPAERKDAAERHYLIWPHRWLSTTVSFALVSAMATGYWLESERFNNALQGLVEFPSGYCPQAWRKSELKSRVAVAEFAFPHAPPSWQLHWAPFFAGAKAPIAQHLAVLFRDRLLLEATVTSMRSPKLERQVNGLFLLGLVQAPRQSSLKALTLGDDLVEFVAHTPFDADSLRYYLANAPPVELAGLTFAVPSQINAIGDDQPWRVWLSALNAAIDDAATPDPHKLGLLKALAEQARGLNGEVQKRLAWATKHWLAYDVLDRLADGQPKAHYQSALHRAGISDASALSALRARTPILELVSGADLGALRQGPRPLASLLALLWDTLCPRYAQPGRPADELVPEQCADVLAAALARHSTASVVVIPKVVEDRVVSTGPLHDSYAFQALLRHASVLSSTSAFAQESARALSLDAAHPGDDSRDTRLEMPPAARTALSLAMDPGDLRLSYTTELKPLLNEANAVLKELRADGDLSAYEQLSSALKQLLASYAGSVRGALESEVMRQAASFSESSERSLAARCSASSKPSSVFQRALHAVDQAAEVALDARKSEEGSGLFGTLADGFADFELPSPLFEADAPGADLAAFFAFMNEIATALAAGEGAAPAERLRAAATRATDPELSALLSPAALLAMSMMGPSPDSLAARFSEWRSTAALPALLDTLVEAPLAGLRALGQRQLKAFGAALWEVRFRPSLQRLAGFYPFSLQARADADPQLLTELLAPVQGKLAKDYAAYVAPLRALSVAIVPAELEASWRRIVLLQSRLWTAAAVPKPYLVKLTPEPFDVASGLMRVELRSAQISALPYVNQSPTAFSLPIDWTSQHDAEMVATFRVASGQGASRVATAPRSFWALLHLLDSFALDTISADACTVHWSVREPTAKIRLRVVEAPFAAFALYGEVPGPCSFAQVGP